MSYIYNRNKYTGRLIIPSSVIPEACYLLNKYLGQTAEAVFIDTLNKRELIIEHFSIQDINRCTELLRTYNHINSGFVDVTLIAIAERLKICKILATAKRQFSAIKPQHCEGFVLLL